MNAQRFVVSDVLWQRLELRRPGKLSDAGATAMDNRLFLESTFWRLRTGSPRRDLHLPLATGTASSAILSMGQVRCIRGSFQSYEP